uniref:Uncharacterized protein n=1 Tax=Arundo donax TaxID=35708 RepID=A0A0A9FEM7_ARUDO
MDKLRPYSRITSSKSGAYTGACSSINVFRSGNPIMRRDRDLKSKDLMECHLVVLGGKKQPATVKTPKTLK